jgi:hypothetical protein
MDHRCSDDGAGRETVPCLFREAVRPRRAEGFTPPTLVEAGSAMSYLAFSCPRCGRLFCCDDQLGRFHEATGEESCPDSGSLQVGLARELQHVPDSALLSRSHSELEERAAVTPPDVWGFRARRDLAADRATREED